MGIVGGIKVDNVSGTDDSLVCQPWRDFCWRAVPLVGNKNLIDELGAKVNTSACETCLGKRRGGTSFCGEGRNVRGNERRGGCTSGGRSGYAIRGGRRRGARGEFKTAPHDREQSGGEMRLVERAREEEGSRIGR